MFARDDSGDHLATDRGRGLFAPALPCPVGAVHIVEPRDARVEPEVLTEVAAHALGKELLPSVPIFRQGGVGVGLLERRNVRIFLFVSAIDACRTRVEEAIDARLLRRQDHVGVR